MNPHAKKSVANSGQREKAAPPPPSFDTLRAVERLKNAEFGEKQAVTLVETLQDVQNELATRADLEKTEFALRNDVEKTELALRGDMEKMESGIRGDMEKMGSSLRGEILELRGEMEVKISRLSWHITTIVGGTASLMTIILSLVIYAK